MFFAGRMMKIKNSHISVTFKPLIITISLQLKMYKLIQSNKSQFISTLILFTSFAEHNKCKSANVYATCYCTHTFCGSNNKFDRFFSEGDLVFYTFPLRKVVDSMKSFNFSVKISSKITFWYHKFLDVKKICCF